MSYRLSKVTKSTYKIINSQETYAKLITKTGILAFLPYSCCSLTYREC